MTFSFLVMVTRLHYLYDQREGGREHFVYYCSNCNCVLHVRREMGLMSEPADSLSNRCLGCGRSLEGNIECRLTTIPDEWVKLYPHAPRSIEEQAPDIRPASSYPHFSLGFPRLDSLFRPLSPGHTVVVSGDKSPTVAELAAFRAQLPLEMGGLDSAVFFIDGGNRSDPYLFSSFARQRRVKPQAAMRRIATCRVFTIYQLADLVSRHLISAVNDYAAQLVVISDLLGTFNEPELDDREARRLLGAVEQAIGLVKKDALVLVTLVSPNKYDDMVMSWADTSVSLTSADGNMRAELLKHPSKPPTVFSFKPPQLLRAVIR